MIRAIVVADEIHTSLIVGELRRGGRPVEHERVDDVTSFKGAVERRIWDVVLADWTLPMFSALRALDTLRDLQRAIPLVIVSGRIGEEAVADGMRAGARDVVLLENLDRLSAILGRELSADRRPRSLGDVSERATALLDSIIENIPSMVIVKDAEQLRFERVNRAGEHLLGHRREELRGKSDHDLFTKEMADALRAKDREILAMSSPADVTVEPVSTVRGQRWLRTLKIAVRDEEGIARHILHISEDITPERELAEALHRTEEQFREAQKMAAIGKLAGGVAHDFNTLLSIILSQAELTRRALSEGDPLRENVDEIATAAIRAAQLTRQLLALDEEQVAAPGGLDLNDAIARIHKTLRRLLNDDVALTTIPAPRLWGVAANPTEIDRILMNLVVNARDAVPDGGRVTIETANVELDESFAQTHDGATLGPHVMLAVSDSGVGMDKPTMARVFEPFFTTKAQGKGTGLGLSTVYEIVRQRGGSIWVSSEPGEGTTFKVYFPPIASGPSAPRRE